MAINSDRFCSEISLEEATSCARPTLNQALAGLPNKRTRIPPVIAAPITELSYWGDNSGATISQLNTRSAQYPSLSGWESRAIPQQPGIYTMSNVGQPINSTNGIAIVPQFPQQQYNIQGTVNQIFYDTNNAISYVYEAPNERVIQPHPSSAQSQTSNSPAQEHKSAAQPKEHVQDVTATRATDYSEPNIANVYDPRFTGYGSDDRCYIDKNLGQPRYFYDDVDSIRMPNYITRNKLDSCLTRGDAYGKIDSGNLSLNEIRGDAERSWLDNSLKFREGMMLSLMRKKNEEQVQKRMAPKYTLF